MRTPCHRTTDAELDTPTLDLHQLRRGVPLDDTVRGDELSVSSADRLVLVRRIRAETDDVHAAEQSVDPLDRFVDRDALDHRLGQMAERIGLREGALVKCDAERPDKALLGRLDILMTASPAEHRIKVMWLQEGTLTRFLLPSLREFRRRVGHLLGGASRVRGDLRRSGARPPVGLHRQVDLLAAFGEQREEPLGEVLDLGEPGFRFGPPDTEGFGEVVAELRFEEEAGGTRHRVELRAVERAPTAVGSTGGVGDDDVPMELRVGGSAGAVPETGGDKAVAGDVSGAVLASAAAAGVVLEPLEGSAHGGLGDLGDLGVELGPEGGEDRDRLRHREGEVESGKGAVRRGERLTVG